MPTYFWKTPDGKALRKEIVHNLKASFGSAEVERNKDSYKWISPELRQCTDFHQIYSNEGGASAFSNGIDEKVNLTNYGAQFNNGMKKKLNTII